MKVYNPAIDELRLVQWWMALQTLGDDSFLMNSAMYSLANFLDAHRPPSELFYEEDDAGWWAVATVAPFMAGGTWGLWLRPDKRRAGRKSNLRFVRDVLTRCLEQYPILVSLCRTPELAAKTVKLGFTNLGVIPVLFEGDPCSVLYLTREQFIRYASRWESLHG